MIKTITFAAAMVLALLLGGCASERNYRNAETLLAANRPEEALAEYRRAMQAEPTNARYRLGYLDARDKSLDAWIEEADRLRRQGDRPADARALYQRALAVDDDNHRARFGMAEIDRDLRVADAMRKAHEEARQGKADLALARLRSVLTDRPQHAAALALRDQLQEQLAKPRAGAEARLAEAYRKPLSIEFRDAPLKQVFEVISRSAGLNFVFDKEVRTDQRTTLFLRNTTVADAVGLALLTNQLEQRVLDAHTVLIYPNTPAKLREYQPLSVKSFFLSSADAKTVANSLKTLLKVKDLVIDEKQNMIVLRDAPEAIMMAEKLVALQDQPEAEVMLEVEILEVKRSRLMQVGVQYPDTFGFAPLTSANGTQLTLTDIKHLSSATTAVTGVSAGARVGSTVSDINVLANPRIRSRNREKARIQVGQRVPNITSTSTSTGFVAESVQYVDVGLKLEVEPTVSPDGEVAIKVALEVSNILQQIQTKVGSVAYEIGTRNANTVLRLRDGENQVLAGLITDNDRRTVNGLPGLSDIPAVGKVLFGNTDVDFQKSEVVLSITPRIVRPAYRPDLATSEFESGTEARVRGRGPDGSVGMPFGPGSTGDTAPARADNRNTSVGASTGSGTGNSTGIAMGTGTGTGTGTGSGSGSGMTATPALPSTVPSNAERPGPGGGASTAPRLGVAVARATWTGPGVVQPGEVFTVQLAIQPERPVSSMQLAIGFDPKVLELQAITEGGFMRQGDVATTFNQRSDAPGQWVASIARPASSGATAPGTVVTLTLRATGAVDASMVQLITASATGIDGQPVIVQLPPPHMVKIPG
jgi:general secretion pathway protein D